MAKGGATRTTGDIGPKPDPRFQYDWDNPNKPTMGPVTGYTGVGDSGKAGMIPDASNFNVGLQQAGSAPIVQQVGSVPTAQQRTPPKSVGGGKGGSVGTSGLQLSEVLGQAGTSGPGFTKQSGGK